MKTLLLIRHSIPEKALNSLLTPAFRLPGSNAQKRFSIILSLPIFLRSGHRLLDVLSRLQSFSDCLSELISGFLSEKPVTRPGRIFLSGNGSMKTRISRIRMASLSVKSIPGCLLVSGTSCLTCRMAKPPSSSLMPPQSAPICKASAP